MTNTQYTIMASMLPRLTTEELEDLETIVGRMIQQRRLQQAAIDPDLGKGDAE